MASAAGEASSSTAAPRSWSYHVFLSFRGEDTRKGFTGHLCASLERKGIKTFKDDKYLRTGEVISQGLMKSIEESLFAITVFSPNYASSSWCLDELQKIADCKSLGLSIVPVFYGVEPSDVRYQKGSFGEAFKKHEERFGQASERVKGWRDALTQVAKISGWDSKYMHEEELVESIAKHIHTELIPKLPSCTENLVGIASRVEEVTRLLNTGLNDVRFIALWGMGGIGKTTIARAVYEAIESKFEVTCFFANVREVCEIKGPVQMQKEFVAHMNISEAVFYNVYDGRKTIRNSLCNRKVLFVLDDVNKISQLENLAANQSWFGSGSRVIITTRDIQLLNIYEVYDTYKVRCLVQNDALHLFCLKAFKQDQPEEEYIEMSNEVVEYSGGLPLALKVLGSYLHRRTVDVWRSALKKIKSVPRSDILDTLKISYEGLDLKEKNVFLDIACFFRGMDKGKATSVLENCGYNPQIEIDVLIERSLITLNQESNLLDMHDLLQEMGRDIVVQKSPNDLSKRSRLWLKEDIDFVLKRNMGTEAIQGIALNSSYEAHWSTEAFSNMSQLKFLCLRGIELPFGLNCLPSSLKVLHWDHFPLKTLPFTDEENEVVEIELPFSKIEQLWHGKKFLEKLRYLDLSYSENLKQTPDVSAIPLLETLVLEECSELNEVHPSLVHHRNLVLLNLSGCQSLKTLRGKLEMSSLKELILTGCCNFEILPEFGECMKHLSKISLKGTAIRVLPTSLGTLVGLSYLNLDQCKIDLICHLNIIHRLKSLTILSASGCRMYHGFGHNDNFPSSSSRLPFLSSLDLSCCNLTEKSFPRDFWRFPSLNDLNLDGNRFVRVPISIHGLPKLKCLRLNRCMKLRYLPKLPSSIVELEACYCDSLKISKSNPLSRACGVFVLPRQDSGHDHVFSMLISGRKIPSFFVHRQRGNCVTVPLPHNCLLNERLGIALCFLLQISRGSYSYASERSLTICNGKRFITKRISPHGKPGFHLYVVSLPNECLGEEFHEDNDMTNFEMLIEGGTCGDVKILSSAARWISKQDIEDINKRKSKV